MGWLSLSPFHQHQSLDTFLLILKLVLTPPHRWITNGHFSDYFTVGCRTEGGFTVLLVERNEGVETKAIKTSYSPSAGTAFVTFDNVRVPVENTLGPEDGGLLVILRRAKSSRIYSMPKLTITYDDSVTSTTNAG